MPLKERNSNRSLSMRQLSAKHSPLLLKTRIRPSWWLRLKLDSSENRARAHCWCPNGKTGSPMTCCKHLSHIGPPWPNGLPGLPEAAQHCLSADTVLPYTTCRRLKTTSKVRHRNEPVRSRVCKPRSTTAICHPTYLLETLATLETLSPRASIVIAWISWF